jgi:hypothetical protein
MISSNLATLRELVSEAKKMSIERRTQFPKYGPYQHAVEQLEFIEKFLSANILPSPEEVNLVDIGLMAAKELEMEDPEYALLLMKVNNRFEDLLDID